MMASESLISVAQNFLSPGMIQKFSNQIQQPVDKTTTGLKSIIPTVLMGIVNKGSTKEGAESLVQLASKQESTLSPESIKPEQSSEVVNGVFGNNVQDVVSKLGMSTGLKSGHITKMLAMITPMVLGVIGSKIRKDNLNASGLMNFLGQQKSSIAGLIPGAGLAGGLSGGLSNAAESVNETARTVRPSSANVIHNPITTKKSWAVYSVLAIAALAVIWWFVGRENRTAITTAPTTVTSQVSTPLSSTSESIQAVSGLSAFMSMSSGELTKRFRFENLNFDTATTSLMAGSEVELDQIANTMKDHQAATVRIEGFTDNVGDPASNLTLSTNRAMEVKRQLTSRGVDASRIEAAGLGASSPVASNTTAEGRAQNRRIELVVKRQ